MLEFSKKVSISLEPSLLLTNRQTTKNYLYDIETLLNCFLKQSEEVIFWYNLKPTQKYNSIDCLPINLHLIRKCRNTTASTITTFNSYISINSRWIYWNVRKICHSRYLNLGPPLPCNALPTKLSGRCKFKSQLGMTYCI